MPDAIPRSGVAPPPELVELTKRYVETHGLAASARVLGVSRHALTSLAAGFRVRRGTVVLVAQALRWPGPASTTPASSGPQKQRSSPPERAA